MPTKDLNLYIIPPRAHRPGRFFIWGRRESPLVLVDEAVEVQFGRPAEAEEGVTDILLHLRSDRPRAIPILVVALAAIGGDKVLLDAHLEMARHIVEDVAS